jgi:cell division protein FtsW (lipid II flippase)
MPQQLYNFVVGWFLMIIVLTLINRTRTGHVIIYYALLLMILFVLVVEYKQIVPYFNAIQSVGDFNTATGNK